MAYKRILTIQDISCVGQCSTTVVLPVLSACGHETCILPTALLSTHTGGFGRPAVVHFDDRLSEIWHHWKDNDIQFDAILVGYLGNEAAVKTAEEIIANLLAPNGVTIVDPAFGDHGKLYSGLSEQYALSMKRLCTRADVIIPNVTEAAFLAGVSYKDTLDEHYVHEILTGLEYSGVVMTGVGYRDGETGIIIREEGKQTHYVHPKIGKNYSGTGDMFAACFTGAWLQGKTKEEAVKIAADFICRSIENTEQSPAHWYGIKFETALPELIRMLQA